MGLEACALALTMLSPKARKVSLGTTLRLLQCFVLFILVCSSLNFLSGRDFLLWSRWGHRPPPPASYYTLRATPAEKVRLVESILAGRVFETNVARLPVLKRLFERYEETKEDVFVDGLSMGAYDDSCDAYYMD